MDTALRVGTARDGIRSNEVAKLFNNVTDAGDLGVMNAIRHMSAIGMIDTNTVSKENFDSSMRKTASYTLTDGREWLEKESSARQNIENIVK